LATALVAAGLACSTFTGSSRQQPAQPAQEVGGVGVLPSSGAEPSYQGKSLSEWILLSDPVGGDIAAPKDWNALPAVRAMGAEAIPWLLRWIRSDQPETAHLGIRGLALLGTAGSRAIPELARLASNWQTSSAWSNAISGLEVLGNGGFPHLNTGFPYLLAAATNPAAPWELRLKAVQSLRHLGAHMNGLGYLAALGTNAALAVPVLIRCAQDPDWPVAAEAAGALGDYTIEPGLSVPALAAVLQSRTNSPRSATAGQDRPGLRGEVLVRWAAASALRDFAEVIHRGGFPDNLTLPPPSISEYREALQAAVTALLSGLHDQDARVARMAASALGAAALEPKLVVPALVESLDHTNAEVRADAAEALGSFGSAARQAVPALISLQTAQSSAKSEPFRGSPIPPPITNADPSVRLPLLVHVPTKLKIERTTDMLSVGIENQSSLETTNLIGTNMVTGVKSELYVYPVGEARPAPANDRGYGGLASGLDFNLGTHILHTKPDGIPLPGIKYVVEVELTVFETDIPGGHFWQPYSKNYRVLWQRTLKQLVE
jgi:HEAT repeat protein